jgi:hypothetical protein
VLHRLGFETCASPTAIPSCSKYDEFVSGNPSFPPPIFLVTCDCSETEFSTPAPWRDRHYLARAVRVPSLIFRHLVHIDQNTVTMAEFCAIWDDAFVNASSAFGPIQFTADHNRGTQFSGFPGFPGLVVFLAECSLVGIVWIGQSRQSRQSRQFRPTPGIAWSGFSGLSGFVAHTSAVRRSPSTPSFMNFSCPSPRLANQ